MSTVSLELIDQLLSPSQNRDAEQHFKAIVLPSRIHGLFTLLSSLMTSNQEEHPRCMLASVLLRRDLSSLGGFMMTKANQDAVPLNDVLSMLSSMVQPLMAFFQQAQKQAQRRISFIIAELCSALSLLNQEAAIAASNTILSAIYSCSKAHKPSLDLLAAIANRAPFALTQEHLASFSNALYAASEELNKSSIGPNDKLACIASILESMLNIALAGELSTKLQAGKKASSSQERMLQMIQLQTMTETNPKKLSIDVSSQSALIGKKCVPPLLSMIGTCLQNNLQNGDTVQTVLQTISSMASSCPSLLSGDSNTLFAVCQTLLAIATMSSGDDVQDLRLAAIEAMVTLFMVPDVKAMLYANPAIMALCLNGDSSNQIQSILHICAESIVRGTDDDIAAWGAGGSVGLMEDAAYWDDDDNAIFAQEIMELFVQSVGGSQCLTASLNIVESLLSNNDESQWKQLRAGLVMLETCLTAAPYSFAPHVPVAVEAALTFANHNCIRVQFQAIQLITSICRADEIDSAENQNEGKARPKLGVRKNNGNRLLEALAKNLGSKCSKVVGHACLALVAYCRGGNGKENSGTSVEKELVLPFLGDILNMIANGPLCFDINCNSDVFIRAFAAIACLADVVGGDFASFYANIMPGLIECIGYGMEKDNNGSITGRGTSSDEIVALRGGAIEAASIVGQAIGDAEGVFNADAEKLMTFILPLLESQSEANATPLIPQDQLLAASARIASVMKASYAPFLPRVLPHLLRKATEEADVSISEGDESTVGQESEFDEDTGMESITVSVPGIGVKKLVLNTIQMQEKAQASRAIYEHANSMGASFGPYASDCFKALQPLLRFKYAAEVRSTAAQALGPVFDSACEYAATASKTEHATLPQTSYSPLVVTMAQQLMDEDDDDVETLSAISEAMSNIAYAAYMHSKTTNSRACMTCNEAKQFVNAVVKVIDKCLKRRQVMIRIMLSGAIDEDQMIEYEDVLNVQSEFLQNLVDSIGYALKTLKELFSPVFDAVIAPFFGPLLSSSGTIDPKARFGAICLFDDCVEHCGSAAALKHGPSLAKAVLEGIQDSDLEVQGASVYGIAQLARYTNKATLQNVANQLIQFLMAIAVEGCQKHKEDIENIRLVENSASALATMTLFKNSPFAGENFPREKITDIFVANLPLQEDFDEAKYCHDGFCDLIENGQVDINANLQQVFRVIGETVDAVNDGDEMATQETCQRFAEIIAAVQGQVDQGRIQTAYENITDEARNGINLLMG